MGVVSTTQKVCHKYMTLPFAGHLHVVTYIVNKHSVFEAYRHHGMCIIIVIELVNTDNFKPVS